MSSAFFIRGSASFPFATSQGRCPLFSWGWGYRKSSGRDSRGSPALAKETCDKRLWGYRAPQPHCLKNQIPFSSQGTSTVGSPWFGTSETPCSALAPA